MRPPICEICDVRFGLDEGGMVTFARAPEDAAWYRRAESPGFTGHPPNVEWFCGKHIAAARALAELTRAAAVKKLREG